MATLLPKHGPHIVLQMGSSWILTNEPRDALCQISHCCLNPAAPFPRNGQIIALIWSKHKLHVVFQIASSWTLINVPKDAPCQISHSQVYPVTPFPRNGQNMALLLPKHGPHMFFKFSSHWILIILAKDVPCRGGGEVAHCPFHYWSTFEPLVCCNRQRFWSLSCYFTRNLFIVRTNSKSKIFQP